MNPVVRLGFAACIASCCLVATVSLGTHITAQPAVSKKSELVDRFRSRYSDLHSLSLSFSSSLGKGSLKAIRNKGFHITIPGTQIIRQGATVWTIQQQTKTVVINSANNASDELSIERIFFALLHVYTPVEQPKDKGRHVLLLSPPSPEARIAGVDQATVYLNKSLDVTRIDVVTGNTASSWTITALKRNPNIDASQFAYKPPKGWTVVDLR